jgi:hypothetical protein
MSTRTCRGLAPLTAGEVGLLELFLDAKAANMDAKRAVSLATAQRLVATLRHTERQLAHARRREDAAFAMLEADLTPSPDSETR